MAGSTPRPPVTSVDDGVVDRDEHVMTPQVVARNEGLLEPERIFGRNPTEVPDPNVQP